MTGTVFNIQSYSLHDGPGIRTVVFLKGCPLRCIWCSNPESQRCEPEPAFDRTKCIHDKGCRWCVPLCEKLLEGLPDLSDRAACLDCAAVCPSGAMHLYGMQMTVEEIIARAEREQAFFRHGRGGITLSGGEPMMQAEFAVSILKEAKRRRIYTAMETCGYCSWKDLSAAAEHLDYILYDVKLLDDEKHRQYTGASNRIILDNLINLFRDFPALPKCIRTPVIPGVNDNREEIAAIRHFLNGLGAHTYELLPYHRFGQGKYAMLGRAYPDLPERLDEAAFAALKAL